MRSHRPCYSDTWARFGNKFPKHRNSLASVQRAVQEISAQRPDTRFGAVFFSDKTPIPMADRRSLGEFAGPNAVSDFCAWVTRQADPLFATTASLAGLDAAAVDLEANSPSGHRRFIAYITDSSMVSTEPQRLAMVQRLDALTEPWGGGVFVSLWADQQALVTAYYSQYFTDDPNYPSLAVNGGFDQTGYDDADPPDGRRYLFDALKARVVYGL